MKRDKNGYPSPFVPKTLSQIGNNDDSWRKLRSICISYFARQIPKVSQQILTSAVRSFFADVLKERLPNLGHGHAVKMGEPEGSSEGDLSFVLFDLMQGRNCETDPIRDLLQRQTPLVSQGAQA